MLDSLHAPTSTYPDVGPAVSVDQAAGLPWSKYVGPNVPLGPATHCPPLGAGMSENSRPSHTERDFSTTAAVSIVTCRSSGLRSSAAASSTCASTRACGAVAPFGARARYISCEVRF